MTARSRLVLVLLWAALPLAATAVVLTPYGRTWFFYDEWSWIARVLSPHGGHLRAAFQPFNGHLQFFGYFVFLAQVEWFGLTNHALVYGVFVLSLVALHVGIAVTLRGLGLAPAPAVVGGLALAYFGTGAQCMVFEVLLYTNFAVFFALVAGLVVIRLQPGPGPAAAVVLALFAATGFDSAIAMAASAFVVSLLAARWRQAPAWIAAALLPPVAAWIAWVRWAGTSSVLDRAVPMAERVEVGVRLVLRSVGGFFGGTEAAGIAVIAVSTAIIGTAVARRRLRGRPLQGLAAGTLAAAAFALAVAATRGGMIGRNFVDFNRYLANIGVFAFVALAPAILASVPAWLAARSRIVTGVATAMCALMFVLNLGPLSSYRRAFEAWNGETRTGVEQAVAVLERGCPAGTHLSLDTRPFGPVAPQISVGLLATAWRRGLFQFGPAAVVDPALAAAMCVASGRPAPAGR